VARRDYTYGSAGDCTITFAIVDPEGIIIAPTGSMHLNLATKSIWLKTTGVTAAGWELSAGGGGGGLPDGDYGDVTISGGGTLITVNDAAITYDKIQDVSGPSIVLGRLSPGPGDIEEIPFSALAAALGINSNPTGNALLSGGGVAWLQNLDFAVSAANYLIQGSQYNSPATNVTLTAANPTNPRIDVIAVNTSGAVVVITGTPAASPEKPDVDPSTQLELTFVYVPALATAPTIVVDVIYRENVEWTSSKSGTPIVLNSTNNPYAGLLDVEATAATTNNFANFLAPAPFDPNAKNTLVLRIRSKAAWPTTRQLNINWRSGTTQRGSTIALKTGVYGFSSSITGVYQTVTIPMTDFGAGGLSVDSLRFTVGGTGGTIGFYLDNIELQTGIVPATPSGDPSRMRWRGDWLVGTSYEVNDTVLYNNIQYVALQANTGQTPSTTSTYWQDSSAYPTLLASGAQVRRTLTLNVINGAWTAIPFNVEDQDTDNYWSVGAPERFTIATAGWYVATLWMGYGATVGRCIVAIGKNGSPATPANEIAGGAYAPAGDGFRGQAAFVGYLVPGDFLAGYTYTTATGDTSTATSPARFGIARLSGGVSGATGATGPASSVMRGATFMSNTVLTIPEAVPVSIAFDKACTIKRVVIMGDVAGNCVVDLKKATIATASGGTGGASIVGSDPPLITGASYLDKTVFIGWTLGMSPGDVLNISLVSVTTFARLTVQVFVE
jgi:hypothetical protein